MQFMRRLQNLTSRGVIQDGMAGSATEEHDVPDRITTIAGYPAVPTPAPDRAVSMSSRSTGVWQAYRDPRSSLVRTRCLKVALSIFSRPEPHPRSLGFVSAIAGEGKTMLAIATASALAQQARRHVTLVDCNWEHPSLASLFEIPDTPGIAEWLRRECALRQIRQKVSDTLTVIPAGDAASDPMGLVMRLRATGIPSLLSELDELLIVDLPPVLTTFYAAELARVVDARLMVVRAHVTWDTYVAQAVEELGDAPLEGMILNGTYSNLPRWLQRLL